MDMVLRLETLGSRLYVSLLEVSKISTLQSIQLYVL